MFSRILPLFLSLLAVLSAAAQREVPRIDIKLADGITLSDLESSKKTWRRAQITITAAGIGKNITDSAKVRGRGNTTWTMKKKPFRFKFDKKQSPFGLAKGKSWVLLANFLSDAQLNNAIAMRTAQLVGASHANHMIPVELYINGSYRGLYNLSEQVGLASNSVAVDDESKAALLEWDTYDGDPKRDSTYKLPVDLKAPELDDYVKAYGNEAAARYEQTLNSEVQQLTRAVLSERTAEVVDVPSLAAFYYVFDLTGNLELRHPKSVNVWRADIFDPQSKWVFGPVWDFDWAYGYEHTGAFATIDPEFDLLDGKGPQGPGRNFFRHAMRGSQDVCNAYNALAQRFVREGGIDSLCKYIDDYADWIAPAAARDFDRWWQGRPDYTSLAERMKDWLTARATYIAEHPIGYVPTGVRAVSTPTRHEEAPIYTLDGRRLSPTAPRPAGVLLQGGRKIVGTRP